MINLKQIIHAGGPVLLVLFVLSIYTLAVAWERWVFYRKVLKGLPSFLNKIRQQVAQSASAEAINTCRQFKHPAAYVLLRALDSSGSLEERREMAQKAIDWQTGNLQKRLGVLATVGSTAPFIGLFGTVLGVMKAFKDLSAYAGAGPSVVAVGIAEALVCTAAGLFVAIPAIIAYNYFTQKSQY
ncbi:MAG: MotA/TolQ/ExbB proton channel family protein, partial [Elusimicrobia bacterium]|nr:MotA/TolQ/ExbB proton channel family protein [Elusimicrobiota bacterium]